MFKEYQRVTNSLFVNPWSFSFTCIDETTIKYLKVNVWPAEGGKS